MMKSMVFILDFNKQLFDLRPMSGYMISKTQLRDTL